MERGISPIVAVVLLIAIAVIAAVGLYFWVGGLATKQPTPSTPVVLSAQKLTCAPGTNTTNLTLMVQHLGSSGTVTIASLKVVDASNRQVAPLTTGTITAGQQALVNWTYPTSSNMTLTSGASYTLYGTGTSSATFVC